MATISNSDQENRELNVEEVDQPAKEMMKKLGIDIGITTFFADPNKALDINKLQSVGEMENNQGNNNSASATDSNGANGNAGGSVVDFVDAKAIAHNMKDIIENSAMQIPEGELNNETKEKIEKKAQRSQEMAEQDKEASRE